MRFFSIGILFIVWSCAVAQQDERVLVTITREYSPIPKNNDKVQIVVDWNKVTSKLPSLKKFSPIVIDQNFSGSIPAKVIDTNGDKKPDYLLIDYVFQSNEPIFSFLVKPDKNKSLNVVNEKITIDSRLKVDVLQSYTTIAQQKDKTSVAEKLVQSTLNTYPDPKDFPIYAPNRWNYEYSFFLLGAYKLGQKKNIPTFIDYPKRWLDGFVEESGGFKSGVYEMDEYKLDDVIPARLAILFHQQTGEAKYKSIVDTIVTQLVRQPKTSEGGYWHKQIYKHQMWLDGIFMADVFSMHYAQTYNQPEWFDEAVHQVKLIYKYTRDEKTGLLYHGWDESKNPVWAHPERGTSPEFWARAIGWYAMALIECLDYLPADHPGRKDVIDIFQKVCASVKKYQHPDNHLWYQVLDKPFEAGNWPEASASAMFAYAFAKGYNEKYLDESFRTSGEKAYNAILNNFLYVDDQGNVHLDQTVKIGTLNPKTSKGDYEYYITTEKRINDYKGLASLLFASIELNR